MVDITKEQASKQPIKPNLTSRFLQVLRYLPTWKKREFRILPSSITPLL